MCVVLIVFAKDDITFEMTTIKENPVGNRIIYRKNNVGKYQNTYRGRR